MGEYLIELPHMPGTCARVMQDFSEEAQQLLPSTMFGCASGHHMAWAMVEAACEEDARMTLPESERDRALIVMVERFSPQQIRKMRKAA